MLKTTLLQGNFYGIFEKKKSIVGNALVHSVVIIVYSQPGVCINIVIIYFIPL
jgi:hypothetical protein